MTPSMESTTGEINRINFRDFIMTKVSVIFSGICRQYIMDKVVSEEELRELSPVRLFRYPRQGVPTLSLCESVTTSTD